MLERWLRISSEKRAAAFYAALLVVAAGLTLAGFEFGFRFLALLVGGVIGELASRLAAYPFRSRVGDRRGLSPIVASLVALASVLVIVFGAPLVGIDSFLSAEGGASGLLVFGTALGFGARLRRELSPPPSASGEIDVRATATDALIIGVPLLLIFGILFGAFVLMEYVAGPLIRYFAG